MKYTRKKERDALEEMSKLDVCDMKELGRLEIYLAADGETGRG